MQNNKKFLSSICWFSNKGSLIELVQILREETTEKPIAYLCRQLAIFENEAITVTWIK